MKSEHVFVVQFSSVLLFVSTISNVSCVSFLSIILHHLEIMSNSLLSCLLYVLC